MTIDKYQQFYMKSNFRSCTHNQIAEHLNKNPKTVAEWLRRHGLTKCSNYTEMELYMLSNFSAKHCLQFIPHKSLNALKIKQCRIRKSILAAASTK